MKLVRLKLNNFRCFGGVTTELALDGINFVIGPNGAGKTAVLQALARMFSLDPAQRKVRPSDFFIAADEKPEEAPATSQEQTRGRLPVPRADDSVSLVLFWSEKSATKEIRELDRQR